MIRCPACLAELHVALTVAAVADPPGTVGPLTALRPDDPPWLRVALGELGQREVAGAAHNPRIVEYHSATTLKATDDETPWCASFVSWCLERAGIPSTRSARALSYAGWGRAIAARRGAVAVFDHGGGRGHVGFLLGAMPDGAAMVLGGNQGDSVKVSQFGAGHLASFRWPEDSTR